MPIARNWLAKERQLCRYQSNSTVLSVPSADVISDASYLMSAGLGWDEANVETSELTRETGNRGQSIENDRAQRHRPSKQNLWPRNEAVSLKPGENAGRVSTDKFELRRRAKAFRRERRIGPVR